jgi:hypothetical protein
MTLWGCWPPGVEPALIRRFRLALHPGMHTGVEAELWFSPLVALRNADGIVLDEDCRPLLRDRLAARPPARRLGEP